jgi:3-dehydroquinate synthase
MKSFATSFGPVYLDEDFPDLARRLHVMSYSSLFILADFHTRLHCVPLVSGLFPHQHTCIIPDGEPNKNLDTCALIWNFLLEHGADRKSVLLNVGGGMLTDIGGFAASCYQRGIRFVQVPTSVMAMTDAAIGGKLGVNFRDHKNYIGVFKAPEFTWIKPKFIQTLPHKEKIAGLAEMIKHAIIGSKSLWEKLNAIQSVDKVDWTALLEESIAVKVMIVQDDPLEKGIRKTLNFGHTIGHALESFFMHSENPLSHGQAVTLGMLAESKMAFEGGLLPIEEFEKILSLMTRLLEPANRILPSHAELMKWMEKDKKSTLAQLHFSLPTEIGSCRWDVTGIGAESAMDWLGKQVSGKSFRLMSDPF